MDCCEAMKDAQQSGTDNEAWGPLVRGTSIGCGLPPIKFCPWCGRPVPGEQRDAD